jgi:hypothetical protein
VLCPLFNLVCNREKIKETPPNFYDIADNCIDKKPLFATDILYYSGEDYTEWQVQYIVMPQYTVIYFSVVFVIYFFILKIF